MTNKYIANEIYKCPNCKEIDNYKWTKQDAECKCMKCNKIFDASNNIV